MPAFDDGLAVQTNHRHLDGWLVHRTVRQLVIGARAENAGGRGLADPRTPVRIQACGC